MYRSSIDGLRLYRSTIGRLSTDISVDISVDCRPIYRPSLPIVHKIPFRTIAKISSTSRSRDAWLVLVVVGRNARAWVKSFKIGEILKLPIFCSFCPISLIF